MSFTVIIPSKNAANLIPCVRALRECEPDCKIVVVDDGLDIAKMTAARIPVRYTPGIKPFVFARNCNLGIRAATPDDVILLNDDALLKTAGGFSALANQAAEHPEYGVIGAVTNITGQLLQRPKEIGLREVTHIAFICAYIPRRTIERVGLLDERYCLDYGVEDRDYCRMCERAGLKVGVYDFCYVDHASLRSTFRGDPKRPLGFEKNRRLYQRKWGTPRYP